MNINWDISLLLSCIVKAKTFASDAPSEKWRYVMKYDKVTNSYTQNYKEGLRMYAPLDVVIVAKLLFWAPFPILKTKECLGTLQDAGARAPSTLSNSACQKET
jgi:hypothetical protein